MCIEDVNLLVSISPVNNVLCLMVFVEMLRLLEFLVEALLAMSRLFTGDWPWLIGFFLPD